MKALSRGAHRVLLAATLTAAAVALSACSADDAAPASSGAAGGDALTPVRLVVAPIHFEAAHIAQEQGYFADHGLEVEIISGGAPLQNIAMAVSGEADIVTGSWGTAVTSIAQGMPLQVIGGNGYTSADFATSGVVVSADSPIQDVADLEGTTIGIQGLNTGSEVPLFFAAEDAGIAPDSFERVELASTAMATSLEEGTVDAVLASAPFFNQLVAAGDRVISEPSMEFLPHAPVTVWTVTDDWLAQNADTAEAFDLAMAEAAEFYMDPANGDAVLDITARVSQVDKSTLSAESLIPISVAINVEAAQKQRDGFVQFGIVESAPTVDEILWEGAPRSE
ncbi:ABC transporter substrate-binding protein [Microbacterium sp.]|uniref:ABC transporter substrate-binding protein n=1 Tax=Microbacterium sp. TaxID=51671 RepID=UPI003A84EBA2